MGSDGAVFCQSSPRIPSRQYNSSRVLLRVPKQWYYAVGPS
ncbi:hypothetical protein [Pantoea phage vB_PdeP_F2M1C]|nr:hypothetical protein [Pantoea phage vB_PdeP_F2M1C]